MNKQYINNYTKLVQIVPFCGVFNRMEIKGGKIEHIEVMGLMYFDWDR